MPDVDHDDWVCECESFLVNRVARDASGRYVGSAEIDVEITLSDGTNLAVNTCVNFRLEKTKEADHV